MFKSYNMDFLLILLLRFTFVGTREQEPDRAQPGWAVECLRYNICIVSWLLKI
jgi:hypothetical protein